MSVLNEKTHKFDKSGSSFVISWNPGRNSPLYFDRSINVWVTSPNVLIVADLTVPCSSVSSCGALTSTAPSERAF